MQAQRRTVHGCLGNDYCFNELQILIEALLDLSSLTDYRIVIRALLAMSVLLVRAGLWDAWLFTSSVLSWASKASGRASRRVCKSEACLVDVRFFPVPFAAWMTGSLEGDCHLPLWFFFNKQSSMQ